MRPKRASVFRGWDTRGFSLLIGISGSAKLLLVDAMCSHNREDLGRSMEEARALMSTLAFNVPCAMGQSASKSSPINQNYIQCKEVQIHHIRV